MSITSISLIKSVMIFIVLARSPAEQEHPVHCVPRLIRGHGGVALGWPKSLDKFISPLPFVSSCRRIGIEYNFSHSSIYMYIISVYLPSRSGCTDDFKESLDQLDAAITLLRPVLTLSLWGISTLT